MARAGKYWVIVSGDVPTSFRSSDKAMLETTLHQLQRTQPDAEIKWFDGTRFFGSRDEALAAGLGKDEVRRERKQDWRPGGDHKDPRAKYDIPRDVRRARFKERAFSKPTDGETSDSSEAPAPKPSFAERKPFAERKSFGERKPFGEKKTFGERKPFGDKKPFGDRKPFDPDRKPAFGAPKRFGAAKPFGGPKKFGVRKPFGSPKKFGPKGPKE